MGLVLPYYIECCHDGKCIRLSDSGLAVELSPDSAVMPVEHPAGFWSRLSGHIYTKINRLDPSFPIWFVFNHEREAGFIAGLAVLYVAECPIEMTGSWPEPVQFRVDPISFPECSKLCLFPYGMPRLSNSLYHGALDRECCAGGGVGGFSLFEPADLCDAGEAGVVPSG